MIQRKIKKLCYWWCKLSSSFLQDSRWNCIRTIRFVYINGTKDFINMSHWTCKIINHALSERCNNLVIDISRSFSKYTMKEFIKCISYLLSYRYIHAPIPCWLTSLYISGMSTYQSWTCWLWDFWVKLEFLRKGGFNRNCSIYVKIVQSMLFLSCKNFQCSTVTYV